VTGPQHSAVGDIFRDVAARQVLPGSQPDCGTPDSVLVEQVRNRVGKSGPDRGGRSGAAAAATALAETQVMLVSESFGLQGFRIQWKRK
jgi:hypothetical protein